MAGPELFVITEFHCSFIWVTDIILNLQFGKQDTAIPVNIKSIEQRCPTLSTFATSDNKPFKRGDRKLFQTYCNRNI